MIIFEKYLSSLLFIFLVVSCGSGEPRSTETVSPDSLTTTSIDLSAQLSNDTSKLSRVLDLHTFRPDSVIFHLNSDDTTTQDFSLEAVLFYEEHVYGAILEKYMDEDFPKSDLKKEDFDFTWLSESLKHELSLSKVEYKGNPDIFLGTDGQAELWFSDRKIFLKWHK